MNTNPKEGLLPEIEPTEGFAEGVMWRVRELDELRAAVAAEERQVGYYVVLASCAAGLVAAWLLCSLLLPPLLALRVTVGVAAEWLRSSPPVLGAPLLWGAAAALALLVVGWWEAARLRLSRRLVAEAGP